jgi:hypothetical protein
MTTIAGHTFVDTPTGRQCPGCGKYWIDVAPGAYMELGAMNIAHTGAMNEAERNQIRDELERIWVAVQKSVAG